MTKKNTATEQSISEHDDHEYEERMRGIAIESALDASGIPNRYRRARFKDYKITTAKYSMGVDNKQEQVLNDCKSFMEDGVYDTGLIMEGRNGTGKTMLACIILYELILRDPKNHYGYRYTEAIKIIRDIKDTWRNSLSSEQQAIDRYVRPKILVIDEIGMQYGSPTEKQFLTEIINDRYNMNSPTILAGNLTSKEIKELLGDRIYDRFCEGGKSLVFNWPSYRLRNKAD